MHTDEFNLFGQLSVSEGIRITQNTNSFSAWKISAAPSNSSLEFYLNGTLKGRINSAGTNSAASDRRLKVEIEELIPTLINVLKLNTKSYVFKVAPDAERSISLIAQEVAEVFSELVEGDPNGEDLPLKLGL